MTARETPWALACDEALSDGEWHEGLPILREAQKKITPGIALRKTERIRETMSAARNDGQARERVAIVTQSRLISMGKRAIMQSVLHARVKSGAWQVRPWPLPADGWLAGGWQVRDVRVSRMTLTALAEVHGIDKSTARELLAQEPPLGTRVGRVMYVANSELEAFAERLRQHRAGSVERRSQASRRTQAARKQRPRSYYTLGDLARLSDVGSQTARLVQRSHPELGWEIVGQSARLPMDRLEDWHKAIQAYQSQTFQRRSDAARRSRATTRAKAAARANEQSPPATPAFADPALTDTFARYRGGDTSLRTEVYQGMREAFQRADADEGDT